MSESAFRVLQVSTHDAGGGAACAARRLHRGLRELGTDSVMFVAHKKTADPTVVPLVRPTAFVARFCQLAKRRLIARKFARYSKTRPAGLYPFSDCRTRYGRALIRQLPAAQVVNLHWVATFLDYRTFFRGVCERTPIVWTLHDMNAFTGGCHCAIDCERYMESCGACPQLGSTDPRDLSREVWRLKQKAFRAVPNGGLHIVALSRWMAGEVRRSSLLGSRPVSVIPNGLDTEGFRPVDKRCARVALGIPENARVVLFAGPLGSKWKGFSDLSTALTCESSLADVVVVSVGHDAQVPALGVRHIHLGYVESDRVLAAVYSAADLLVFPTLHDNLPNTVMESMACGTPVVGYDVGGVPDLVRSGVTGLLLPPGDVVALGSAIAHLLDDETQRREMSKNCRSVAVEEYSLEIQARRYVELYERILDGERG